jgi:hypothetical protein
MAPRQEVFNISGPGRTVYLGKSSVVKKYTGSTLRDRSSIEAGQIYAADARIWDILSSTSANVAPWQNGITSVW